MDTGEYEIPKTTKLFKVKINKRCYYIESINMRKDGATLSVTSRDPSKKSSSSNDVTNDFYGTIPVDTETARNLKVGQKIKFNVEAL